MQYTSTRAKVSESSSHCLLAGISSDGGLYVPKSFPNLSGQYSLMAGENYVQRALRVLTPFFTDFSKKELDFAVRNAYGPQFDHPKVAPLRKLGAGDWLQELWHGPTLAFKDYALQLLPRLMGPARQRQRMEEEVLILVATSGDTGKAALEGFADVPGMRIAVFYPSEGVSPLQKLQMVTQQGSNVAVFGVKGNFDDAQTSVKHMFADPALNEVLLARGFRFSSANSINWGRLAPQIVYYFSAYADLLAENAIQPGEKVNFVVPTGNFGNILAGHYARRMGLPINMLICASNQNNVLTQFFADGLYNANRPFYKTISPSMDILISSNLERLLYEVLQNSEQGVQSLMRSLKETGSYQLPEQAREQLTGGFWAGFATEEQTRQAIRNASEHNLVCDPHTAVALYVREQYKQQTGDTRPTVILSTASPYKFARDVANAITGESLEEGAALSRLEKLGLPLPLPVALLQSRPVLHPQVLEKTQMANALLQFTR